MDRAMESDRTTIDYGIDWVSPGELVAATSSAGQVIRSVIRQMIRQVTNSSKPAK